jgi:hypothetical protein
MTNDVWYVIPSASPLNCRDTLPRWKRLGYKTAVLFNNIPFNDIPFEADYLDRYLFRTVYPGWPQSINLLCRELSEEEAPLFVTGGDDMWPEPSMTASEAADIYWGRFPGGRGVMQPMGDNFGQTRSICGSPFFSWWWSRNAYGGKGPFWPAYYHYSADKELYEVTKMLGCLSENHDMSHYHDHHNRGDRRGTKKLPYIDRMQRHAPGDKALYKARETLGFPGHMPLDWPSSPA